MRVAITGATGFIGRYLVERLARGGHSLKCMRRATSEIDQWPQADAVEWIEGQLGDAAVAAELVRGCDAIVHAALWSPLPGFRGVENDLIKFVEINVAGSLQLIEAARAADVGRFIFVSTCAVHQQILSDRPLDETHPLWPTNHYGAHKAALEKFVHSYGLGFGYPICAVRPTGVYGVARPVERSKWFDIVQRVTRGETVECNRGGKEVHAADVARAAELLLTAAGVAGQAYNCYDMYVSQYDVACYVKQVTGSSAEIMGGQTRPKHQIETGKIRELGMQFGGRPLWEQTLRQLIDAA